MAETPKSQWEYIYQSVPTSEIPWETGEPSADLITLFKKHIITANMNVLDVGCGLGTQTRFIVKKGARATGIDISETAIRKAREQLLKDTVKETDKNANFVVGDVCKMPFAPSSFDFVYDRGCYHHLTVKQRRDYAKEMSRVLHAKGSLHMLVFAGTMTPLEVINNFLPNFRVTSASENIVIDRTNNNQEIPIHLLRFKKLEENLSHKS